MSIEYDLLRADNERLKADQDKVRTQGFDEGYSKGIDVGLAAAREGELAVLTARIVELKAALAFAMGAAPQPSNDWSLYASEYRKAAAALEEKP